MVARSLASALALLALSVPAWAASESVDSTRVERVDTRENLPIFRDVQHAVLRYPHFTIFDSVHAQIDEGVVVLSGKVTMPYKREEIARRVGRIRGVREVQNQIDVLPVSQFDDALRVQIARAIYSHSAFRPFASAVNPPIHVIVERGRVTLEGVVQSEVDRALARSIAGSFNAFEIRNALKTAVEARADLERI
jgi:hyperosmotically inducible periplasmic protein